MGGGGGRGIKNERAFEKFFKRGGGREFDPAFFLRFGWNLVGKGNCDF